MLWELLQLDFVYLLLLFVYKLLFMYYKSNIVHLFLPTTYSDRQNIEMLYHSMAEGTEIASRNYISFAFNSTRADFFFLIFEE